MATSPSWSGTVCHPVTVSIPIFGHVVPFEEHAANAMCRAVTRACTNAPDVARKIHSVGTYNCRQTTGGHSWSEHSWAGAVDLNPSENPYSSSGRLITQFTPEFVGCFHNEGFGWGGDWHSVKDAMHMSIATNEGGHISPQTYDPNLATAAVNAWKHLTGATTPAPTPPPHKPGVVAPPFVRLITLERPAEHGDHIRAWQARMQQRGWTVVADGYYGEKSYGACMAFQREHGLTVDGIIGPMTWKATWEAPIR